MADNRGVEYGFLDRSAKPTRFRRHTSVSCPIKCKPHLPRSCRLPFHALIIAAVLLAGLLPLYFYSVHIADMSNENRIILCGLYPNHGSRVLTDTGEYSGLPNAPALPAAPPGARDITDPTQCKEEFETLFDYSDDDETSPWGKTPLIAFVFTIEDVDPKLLMATLRLLAYLRDPYRGSLGRIKLPEGIVLSMSLNGATPDEFSDGDSFISGVPKKADNLPINGKPGLSNYPFDRYRFWVYLTATFINTTDNNSTAYVPFVAAMETRNPSFSFTAPVEESQILVTPNVSGVAFRIHVSRTDFTKAFATFIFVAMWALTLFCVGHAIKYLVKDLPLGYDVPTYSATLLFALPAVRQVMPGVPDVGAIIDILGFFWNMVLLVMVCLVLVAKIYGSRMLRGTVQLTQVESMDSELGVVGARAGGIDPDQRGIRDLPSRLHPREPVPPRGPPTPLEMRGRDPKSSVGESRGRMAAYSRGDMTGLPSGSREVQPQAVHNFVAM